MEGVSILGCLGAFFYRVRIFAYSRDLCTVQRLSENGNADTRPIGSRRLLRMYFRVPSCPFLLFFELHDMA